MRGTERNGMCSAAERVQAVASEHHQRVGMAVGGWKTVWGRGMCGIGDGGRASSCAAASSERYGRRAAPLDGKCILLVGDAPQGGGELELDGVLVEPE